jgi:N-acetylneuraminate synthase
MTTRIKIKNHQVGHNQPCFIVAEIGINHNGDINIAKNLIDIACEAGVNAVKFQKRTVDVVYSEADRNKPREIPEDVLTNALERNALPAEAVSRLKANKENTTNGDQKYCLELGQKEYEEINRYCQQKNIMWFASCWDEASVDFIEQFNPPCYKIPSSSLTDDELLKYTRAKGKPIILSTGMSTLEQIEHAINVLGSDNLVLMHCVGTYPAKDEDLNLSVITTYKQKFPDLIIGYSGHEVGVSPSVASAVIGAKVVERHITLDRAMWGSDQAASLGPKGIKLLVRDIRLWELAKGDGIKKLIDAEIPVMKKLRRK